MLEWLREEIGRRMFNDLQVSQSEVLLISPYVKAPILTRLVEGLANEPGLTLITDLSLRDLATGATDVDALIDLASSPLGSVRGLRGLHAKVFCRDWRSWWVGSANLTNGGMGLVGRGNVEVMAHLSQANQSLLDAVNPILHESCHLPLSLLRKIQEEVEPWKGRDHGALEELDAREEEHWLALADRLPRTFMVQELPLCPSPEDFQAAVLRGPPWPDPVAHDRSLFGVAAGDSLELIRQKCRRGLERTPVVRGLDELLRTPRRFGEVSAWMHTRCEDRPVPYRSEIKVLTARVLAWMLVCFPDRYTKSRPRHSEVFEKLV